MGTTAIGTAKIGIGRASKVHDLFVLTILYDGATWSLTSRESCMIITGARQQELFQLEVTEGESVTAVPPFRVVRDLFRRDGYKQLDIGIVEVDVGQDLMSGKIQFHGSGD